MQATTYNQAMKNFAELMNEVNDNHEPLIITHENYKSVVLLSLEDFNSLQETKYLTNSTVNAMDLLSAVQELKERTNLIQRNLIEI